MSTPALWQPETAASRRDEIGSLVRRATIFAILTPAVYLSAMLVLANIDIGPHSVADYLAGDVLRPQGYSRTRFREVERYYGQTDILFIGSSHAYRSFDPRIFEAAGYRSFNMGSTAQTPLNTYFLLERYLEPIDPGTVIIEVYLEVLDKDGVESYFDLVASSPLHLQLLEMAVAIRKPDAVNALAARLLRLRSRPADPSQPGEQENGGRYVPGGYVESTTTADAAIFAAPHEIEPSPKQLAYLKKSIDLVIRHGARPVLALQPLPTEAWARILNAREISQLLEHVATRRGVPFYDLQGALPLVTHAHFMDSHHLNAAGVAVYDAALLELLRRDRVLRDAA